MSLGFVLWVNALVNLNAMLLEVLNQCLNAVIRCRGVEQSINSC